MINADVIKINSTSSSERYDIQLKNQGFILHNSERYEKLRFSIDMLYFHNFISYNQKIAYHDKLIKYMCKDIERIDNNV